MSASHHTTRSSDGQRIAYECIDTGRAAVFLHGLSDSRHSWHELGYVQPLLAAGSQVILMDCRGHGDSGKPHDPAAYAPRRRAEDVVSVLDTVGVERADLIGYSMGGGTALATALFFPQRVHRLVVIAAHPFAQDMTPFRHVLSDGIQGWIDLLEANGLPLSADARQRIVANDTDALRACVGEDRADSSALVEWLRSPLLAIAGSLDPASAAVRRFAELAGGEFRAIEGCNHFTVFSAARETVPAIVEFIGRAQVYEIGRV
jgi:pimeloyl-ACP methyl ester carboxylesterase